MPAVVVFVPPMTNQRPSFCLLAFPMLTTTELQAEMRTSCRDQNSRTAEKVTPRSTVRFILAVGSSILPSSSTQKRNSINFCGCLFDGTRVFFLDCRGFPLIARHLFPQTFADTLKSNTSVQQAVTVRFKGWWLRGELWAAGT